MSGLRRLIAVTATLPAARRRAVERGELRHVWPGLIGDVVALWWFRGVWNPIQTGIARGHYLRHQGDTESPWWMPRPQEKVRDCFGRRGTVIVASVVTGKAMVSYGSAEPGRLRVIDWRNCLSPDAWAEAGVQHGSGAHSTAVFVGRDLAGGR